MRICARILSAALFIQRRVLVSALGRVDAGRASGLSHSQCRISSSVAWVSSGEDLVALFRDADAALVAVVNEDCRDAGVRVQRCRKAAEVPAVAHGVDRCHGDHPVLDRVDAAVEIAARLQASFPGTPATA